MAGNVKEFTDNNWKSEVLDSQVPVVVNFWAPWCGPCRTLGPTIEKLAGDYDGRVKVGKMNTDENMDTPGSSAHHGDPHGAGLPARPRGRAPGGRQPGEQVQGGAG